MDDFETIVIEKGIDGGLDRCEFRCKTCGTVVPAGIFNISQHWAACSGKGFCDAMMAMAEQKKGKLTEQDLESLKKGAMP